MHAPTHTEHCKKTNIALTNVVMGLPWLAVVFCLSCWFPTQLQADYHSLIGITADLVDALEATVQGRPVSDNNNNNLPFSLQTSELFLLVA